MIRILLIITILLLYSNANAQQFQAEFKNWALFSYKEDGKKVCYITANPAKKAANFKNRKDVYMLVTLRGEGTTPEVSINSGFPYKKGSTADLTIESKQTFKFFTSDETPQMAWAKDEKTDKAVIDLMKNSAKISTIGTSAKGTTAKDIYSLRGFTAAYDKMLSSCK